MDWLVPKAAYIHIPFCSHKCGYCDFAVSTDQSLKELYLDALELELRGEPEQVETIFIGGGTPTSLSVEQLDRLMALIARRFPRPWGECTIESNPESYSYEMLTMLKSQGLTRLSLGVQSFNDRTLTALDRQHNWTRSLGAAFYARNVELDLSLDLIFGAPGQTLDDWTSDLGSALITPPEHISTYGLTYEKGTPFWKQKERGEITPADEEHELALYETANDHLTAAGYEHYEISNFAKPGHRCRHNEIYWANHAYHGFGVGAARYVNGERSVNVRDTNTYIRRSLAGDSPVQSRECLTPRDRAFETMAVQLRRAEGISRERFRFQTGFRLEELIAEPEQRLAEQELLDVNEASIRLTRRGKCLADAVIAKLMESQ